MQATFTSRAAAVESAAALAVSKAGAPASRAVRTAARNARVAKALGDRAVSIALDGTIALLRGVYTGKQRATFPSLNAAAAALEPVITWASAHAAPSNWSDPREGAQPLLRRQKSVIRE